MVNMQKKNKIAKKIEQNKQNYSTNCLKNYLAFNEVNSSNRNIFFLLFVR